MSQNLVLFLLSNKKLCLSPSAENLSISMQTVSNAQLVNMSVCNAQLCEHVYL